MEAEAPDRLTRREDIRYNLLQKQLQTEATHLPVRRAAPHSGHWRPWALR